MYDEGKAEIEQRQKEIMKNKDEFNSCTEEI